MLKAINTKILLSILAALIAIGGLLAYRNHVAEQAAADAAKTRLLLQQQRKEADQQKQDDEEFRRKVEAEKHKSKAFNRGGSYPPQT